MVEQTGPLYYMWPPIEMLIFPGELSFAFLKYDSYKLRLTIAAAAEGCGALNWKNI